MKRNAKIIAAAVLTLFVLFSMSFPSFATGDCKITIRNTNDAVSMEGHIYNAYKLFDVTYDATNDTYDYTLAAPFDTYFGNLPNTVINESLGEDLDAQAYAYVAAIDDPDEFQAFARDILAAAGSPTASGEAEGPDFDTVEIDQLDPGYYLISDAGLKDTINPDDASNAQKAIANIALKNALSAVTINLKASVPTLEKKITGVSDTSTNEASDNGLDAVSAQVNQHVGFQIDSNVPDLTGYDNYVYKVTDTMSDGLTPDNNVKIVIGTTDVTALCQDNITVSGQVTTIQIPYSVLKPYSADTPITITYSATVNANAGVYPTGDGLTNQAKLEYSNNVNQVTDTEFTPPTDVKVYLFSLEVKKVNSDNQPLEGAKFVLKDSDDNYVPVALDSGRYKVSATLEPNETNATVTSGSDGMIYVDGIAAGDYSLTETVAPDGYNLLKNPVVLQVRVTYKADGTVDVLSGNTATVVNKAGGLLPETGGIGTYIFTIGGAVLMLTAAFILISKKKKADVK